MKQAIQHGADIIIRDWVRLRARERLLIISSQKYSVEIEAMQAAARMNPNAEEGLSAFLEKRKASFQ